MSKKFILLFSLIFSLFFISSCHHFGQKQSNSKQYACKKKCCRKQSAVTGHAIINPVKGNSVSGEIYFEKVTKRTIQITSNVKGLKQNKKFGFHIHEFGNCQNKALLSGAHLNPLGQKHGAPHDKNKHLGDLGNLKSNTTGKALYSNIIYGSVNQFLGRSVIIHAMPDDLKNQPTGNSGNRIACGIIVASIPSTSIKTQKVNDKKTSVQKVTPLKQNKTQKVNDKKKPQYKKSLL